MQPSVTMGELKTSRERRTRTQPIELEEVSIVEELDLAPAPPKKEGRRPLGTAPPAATTAGDDWLDRLDL